MAGILSCHGLFCFSALEQGQIIRETVGDLNVPVLKNQDLLHGFRQGSAVQFRQTSVPEQAGHPGPVQRIVLRLPVQKVELGGKLLLLGFIVGLIPKEVLPADEPVPIVLVGGFLQAVQSVQSALDAAALGGEVLPDRWGNGFLSQGFQVPDGGDHPVQILQDNLLAPVLGIDDPRTDPRIDFVGGVRGLGALEDAVDGEDATVAFSLYPTSMDQLMTVADKGLVMPPKSTWFEPKLRDALTVHLIGDEQDGKNL